MYKLLEFRSENDIDLHVKEVRKSGNQTKMGNKEYKLLDFDTQQNEILEDIKKAKYRDLEDLGYKFQQKL